MLPNPLETVKLATFTKEILKSSLIHSLQYLIYKGLKNYIFLSLLDYILPYGLTKICNQLQIALKIHEYFQNLS